MNLLATTAADWGLPLSQYQLEQFALYAQELISWNTRVNLTAITDADGIITRHFLDSLRCAQSWGMPPRNLVDIGTGAGFPGLPLKILRPELKLTLVESIAKKARFLQHIVDRLELENVKVVVARAEAIGHVPTQREHYDLVVARAVAELRILAEYCLPLCRVGGRVLTPKGAQSALEVQAAQSTIRLLGGQLVDIEQVDIPRIEPRTLVIIDKIAPTPAQYPRATGVPAKRPL